MIHWKREGQIIHQGLNVYHPKDESSMGFVLRIGNRMWRVRYSKHTKIWYTDYVKVDPDAINKFLRGGDE